MLMPVIPRFSRKASPTMKLADWLKKKGKSHSDFAKECGVTQSAIWQLCNGGWISAPLAMTIKRLTQGEVTADDFLPNVDSPRTAHSPRGQRKARAASR
jgi:transcriptional regulator with XRE-family HTH domain